MDLCFFRGTTLVSKTIRAWTRSPWSHVEFEFSDKKHWGAHPKDPVSGWRTVTEDYTAVKIDLAQHEEARLRDWCESESGCPYDWRGIFLSQVLNLARSTTHAWFCSEACVAGLQHVGKFPSWAKPSMFSPGELARIWGEMTSV